MRRRRASARRPTAIEPFTDKQIELDSSAEEALGKLDDGVRPELIVVLSDINMPGMDGLGLLREVKRRNPELPVIKVTAYGDDERRRTASEYGAAKFVTKPVDFDLLKQHLQQLSPPLQREPL